MAEKSFLAGLMLIVLAGVILTFVLGGMQTGGLILSVVLALLAIVTLLSFWNTAKAYVLFQLFFLAGLLFSAISFLQGNRDLVLLVVGIATIIGLISALAARGPARGIVRKIEPVPTVQTARPAAKKKPARKAKKATKKPAKKRAKRKKATKRKKR